MAVAGSGEEVKLLGRWPSPFVIRARITLNLKGVEYEFLEEIFGIKSEFLIKSNPVYKKIPVLIHDGKPICESMIIVQYIDDVWATGGPSILPSNPYDRAIARFWAVYIDDKLLPSLLGILKAKTEEAKTEAAEQAVAGLQLLEEAFQKCCKGKCFFGGDTVGYLDIALGSHLGWLRTAEELGSVKLLDDTKTPHLVGWAEQFWSVDAVKEVMPETAKFVEYAKMVQAWWNAEPSN